MASILSRPQCVKSLWSNGAIWLWRSKSTLVQVMAWCQMAPSHYLNQCWLILWHSHDGSTHWKYWRCHSLNDISKLYHKSTATSVRGLPIKCEGDFYILFNSLVPGKSGCNIKNAILTLGPLRPEGIALFHLSTHPALVTSLQPIIFNRSCLVQPLTWMVA